MASRRGFIRPPRFKTIAFADAPYTLNGQEDGTVSVDTSGGSVGVTLPAAPEDASKIIIVKSTTDANTLTVTAGAGTTIGGSATLATALTTLPSVELQYDKTLTNWLVIADSGFSEPASTIPLASAHILVGSAGGRAADVAVSGDASMANTGAVTVTGLNGATTATTGTEATVLHSVVAGTAAVSKAVVLDTNGAIDSGFKIKLGAAVTAQSPPPAALAADVVGAASGTTQSTFYPLSTITIPANAMSVNGKGIEFTFAATTAANANAKDFRLHFGAATVTLVTGSTASGKPVVVSGAIYRTNVGAQLVVAQITIDTTTATVVSTASADETAAWSFALESQNTAAAAASATGKFGNVWFQN